MSVEAHVVWVGAVQQQQAGSVVAGRLTREDQGRGPSEGEGGETCIRIAYSLDNHQNKRPRNRGLNISQACI